MAESRLTLNRPSDRTGPVDRSAGRPAGRSVGRSIDRSVARSVNGQTDGRTSIPGCNLTRDAEERGEEDA